MVKFFVFPLSREIKNKGKRWKFRLLPCLLPFVLLIAHYKQTKQWHTNNQPLTVASPPIPNRLPQLVLHSKSILKLCWTLREGLKNTYFSFLSFDSSFSLFAHLTPFAIFAPIMPVLILLTFHLFFYCLGWKTMKIVMHCRLTMVERRRKDAVNLGQSLHASFALCRPPHDTIIEKLWKEGELNFCRNFYYKWKLEIERLNRFIFSFRSGIAIFNSPRVCVDYKVIASFRAPRLILSRMCCHQFQW